MGGWGRGVEVGRVGLREGVGGGELKLGGWG